MDEEKIVIKPLKTAPSLKEILNENIPEFLPKLPLICSVVARTNSGKSVVITSLIADYYVPIGTFKPENIFYISPSIHIDPTFKKLPDGVKKYETYDESLLIELMDEMKEKRKMYNDLFIPPVLCVFDDCLAETNDNGRRAFDNNSIISKLFTRGRHLGISVIVTSQKYNSLSRTIKVNSLYVIFLNSIEGEVETILEDHASRHRKKDFLKMWEGVFDGSDHYVNLMIDTTSKNPRKKYIVNFQRYVSYM